MFRCNSGDMVAFKSFDSLFIYFRESGDKLQRCRDYWVKGERAEAHNRQPLAF